MLIPIGANQTAHVTPDGLQWMDAEGNQPSIDLRGCLREPFMLTTFEVDGVTPHRKERWLPPARLPLTPAALRASVRPGVSDTGAGTGNSEGGSVAIEAPAATRSVTRAVPKPTGKKVAKGRGAAGPRPNSAAGQKRAAESKAPKAKASSDGQASKPTNGIVYLRHMRSPRDAFVLIKNQSVFGTESNWALKEEFKSAQAAIDAAGKNGLKVINPPK